LNVLNVKDGPWDVEYSGQICLNSNKFKILFLRIILLDDAMDCLISFSDFIYAFQIQFYYEGMYIELEEILIHYA